MSQDSIVADYKEKVVESLFNIKSNLLEKNQKAFAT